PQAVREQCESSSVIHLRELAQGSWGLQELVFAGSRKVRAPIAVGPHHRNTGDGCLWSLASLVVESRHHDLDDNQIIGTGAHLKSVGRFRKFRASTLVIKRLPSITHTL